ncbi:MAG: response regulator transcription factor, partial [Campylobacterales bacterium]
MTYNANMKLTDCSILVVDDDELVIHSISNFLKPRCKKVYVAHNGIEALDIYYGHEIDVMFVDIEMPKMNGLEFIREVRNTNKQVKIFVCTGHSTKEYLLEAVPLHLEGFVIKPITTRKLLECLYQAKTKNGNIEYQISSTTGLRYQFNTKRLIL